MQLISRIVPLIMRVGGPTKLFFQTRISNLKVHGEEIENMGNWEEHGEEHEKNTEGNKRASELGGT